jgi:hypothetical protein
MVTLNNFWGLIDMKILYLALSPQLQMHIYFPETKAYMQLKTKD